MKKIYNIQIISILVVVFGVSSCEYFQTKEIPQKVVARVGDDFLYQENIKEILPKNYSVEDSLRISTAFINNWALKKLLMIKAQENISNQKKEDFEKLIQEYRNDLYTQTYMEMIVNQQLDTIVSQKQKQDFYQQNKEMFKLNEELLKIRYIHLLNNDPKGQKIIEKFKRFQPKDKKELEMLSLHFVSSFLNDSIWVKASDVYEKVPFLKAKITGKNAEGMFFEEKDSVGNYIVKIDKVLIKNDLAPIQYVNATLGQIIINQRKLEYIKNLEEGIINTATKKKQFEIYE